MGKWKHRTRQDVDTKIFFLYMKHVASILRVNYTSALVEAWYKRAQDSYTNTLTIVVLHIQIIWLRRGLHETNALV